MCHWQCEQARRRVTRREQQLRTGSRTRPLAGCQDPAPSKDGTRAFAFLKALQSCFYTAGPLAMAHWRALADPLSGNPQIRCPIQEVPGGGTRDRGQGQVLAQWNHSASQQQPCAFHALKVCKTPESFMLLLSSQGSSAVEIRSRGASASGWPATLPGCRQAAPSNCLRHAPQRELVVHVGTTLRAAGRGISSVNRFWTK
jgi:hypothetical protein